MTAPALLATPNTVFPLALCDTCAPSRNTGSMRSRTSRQGPRVRGLPARRRTWMPTLACRIRLRAGRKAGELLRAMDKTKGGRPKTAGGGPAVSSSPTIRELGVSEVNRETGGSRG
jgi:hypothetical protein